MAITVKKTFLWKKELDNHPGAMAEALEPLAESGADLQLVMVYRSRRSQRRDRGSPYVGKKIDIHC
jgi:ACT domain-containing protein